MVLIIWAFLVKCRNCTTLKRIAVSLNTTLVGLNSTPVGASSASVIIGLVSVDLGMVNPLIPVFSCIEYQFVTKYVIFMLANAMP